MPAPKTRFHAPKLAPPAAPGGRRARPAARALPQPLPLFLVALLAACQTLPEPPSSAPPVQPAGNAPRAVAAPKPRPTPRPASKTAPVQAEAPADETIRIAPGETALSPDQEARLANFVLKVKPNDQLRIRLEAYSPERGSNAWEIAMAEQSLQIVRARLQAQGIRPYRIETVIVGDRSGSDGTRDRNGVRLYIIEPSSN